MRAGWKRINVVLTEAEYLAFKEACEAHRVSMNRVLRTMIYKKVTKTGPISEPTSKRGPVLKKAEAEAEELKRQASEGQQFIPGPETASGGDSGDAGFRVPSFLDAGE